MKESYEAQIKFEKETSGRGLQYQVDRYDKAAKGLKNYNEELQIQAYLTPQIQKMQQRLDEAQVSSLEKAAKNKQKQFDKDYALLEKEEKARIASEKKVLEQRERLNKATAEAEYKASLERHEQWAKDIQEFKQSTDNTIALIEKKRAAQQAADQNQIKSAAQVYKEQLAIEKKLASGTAGKNETAALQKQLAEKQAAFSKYGKSIQDAAKADADVVKAQQELMVTQAQAADRA